MKKHTVTEAVEAVLHSTSPVGRPLTPVPPGEVLPPVPPVEVAAPVDSGCWVGIDVATWPAQDRLQVTRDEAGLAELVAWLRPRTPRLIVLEATGGLETPSLA